LTITGLVCENKFNFLDNFKQVSGLGPV